MPSRSTSECRNSTWCRVAAGKGRGWRWWLNRRNWGNWATSLARWAGCVHGGAGGQRAAARPLCPSHRSHVNTMVGWSAGMTSRSRYSSAPGLSSCLHRGSRGSRRERVGWEAPRQASDVPAPQQGQQQQQQQRQWQGAGLVGRFRDGMVPGCAAHAPVAHRTRLAVLRGALPPSGGDTLCCAPFSATASNRRVLRAWLLVPCGVAASPPHLTVKKASARSGEILVSASSRISSGSFSPARANSASALGMVAEKSRVWREGPTAVRICGGKGRGGEGRGADLSGCVGGLTRRAQAGGRAASQEGSPPAWRALATSPPRGLVGSPPFKCPPPTAALRRQPLQSPRAQPHAPASAAPQSPSRRGGRPRQTPGTRSRAGSCPPPPAGGASGGLRAHKQAREGASGPSGRREHAGHVGRHMLGIATRAQRGAAHRAGAAQLTGRCHDDVGVGRQLSKLRLHAVATHQHCAAGTAGTAGTSGVAGGRPLGLGHHGAAS